MRSRNEIIFLSPLSSEDRRWLNAIISSFFSIILIRGVFYFLEEVVYVYVSHISEYEGKRLGWIKRYYSWLFLAW